MSKYQSSSPNVNLGGAKIILAAILVLIIIGVVASASVKIVDAGNRGILTHWNAVDLTSAPLDEGIHFVIPFQDDVVQMEVRTLKYDTSTRSASQDLQTVQTTVTVNYHPDTEKVTIFTRKLVYHMKIELFNQQSMKQ